MLDILKDLSPRLQDVALVFNPENPSTPTLPVFSKLRHRRLGYEALSFPCVEPVWDELFPAEQARIVQLLVERVDVREGAISLTLRTEGLGSLVQDLRASGVDIREAA